MKMNFSMIPKIANAQMIANILQPQAPLRLTNINGV